MTDDEIIRTVSDDLPVGVWVARAPKGEFVYANKMFGEIMGMSARSDVAAGEYAQPYGICGRDGEPYPENKMPFVRALLARETVIVDDIVIHRTDGRKVNIRAQARPVFEPSGEIGHIVIAFIDITREVVAEAARVDSEERLHRGQRLESIGNLAGGIAHDFNNLLATIRMAASTLQLRETDPSRREALELIDQVTESGIHLTRSLLGFAGRGKHLAAPLHLNDVVKSMGELFRRTLNRRIEVVMELTRDGDVVLGDFSQLEQVVMNLMVNARDAIPDAGTITLRTWRSSGSDPEGDSVVFEVSDTGTGIDPAIHHRIFEPYFTTKTTGPVRGTGLGLATVYGIVESHGGL
ncbi:MAG: two-component system sensor histidine kinase NtrB, partial [Myxococcaceae bacterium]